MTVPKSMPMSVTTGSMALRRPCLTMTSALAQALGRAVRM